MKKALFIARRIFVLVVAVFAAIMVGFTIISTFVVEKQDKNILGYKMFTVLTDSMSDTFSAGDIIICKEIDPDNLAPGDIITFTSTNSDSYGKTLTHKIRSRTVTERDQDAFITYGTTTGKDDESPVVYNRIIGKYQSKLPGVGKLLEFLKTPTGYVLFILIPFVVLILLQVLNTVKLYKKRQRELKEEDEEDRNALAANKEQTAALMEEIRLLKEQINKNPDSEAEGAKASKSSAGEGDKASKSSAGEGAKASKGSAGEGAKASKGSAGEGAKASKGSAGESAKASKGSAGEGAKASKGSTGEGAKASKGSTGEGAKASKGSTGEGAKASKGSAGEGAKASKGSAGEGD